jgi:hypothetical protein
MYQQETLCDWKYACQSTGGDRRAPFAANEINLKNTHDYMPRAMQHRGKKLPCFATTTSERKNFSGEGTAISPGTEARRYRQNAGGTFNVTEAGSYLSAWALPTWKVSLMGCLCDKSLASLPVQGAGIGGKPEKPRTK